MRQPPLSKPPIPSLTPLTPNPTIPLCSLCNNHFLCDPTHISTGDWHCAFKTTPRRLWEAAETCLICRALTRALYAYKTPEWMEKTRISVASKAGVPMVVWWIERAGAGYRSVRLQLFTPAGIIISYCVLFEALGICADTNRCLFVPSEPNG